MIGILFKYRLKMMLGAFRGGGKIGRTILVIFAFIMLAFALSSFAYGLLKFAELEPENGPRLLENLVAISFHGLFVLLLFWGMSMAVFTIFFSSDLPLLLSYPIPSRKIFTYKIIEATLLNARLSFLFLIPTLIIFGIFHNASFLYYIVAALVTFFMASVPGGLGIIIASAVSQKIPRTRLKGILTVTGSFIGIGLWALFNQFSGRFSSESADFGSATMKTINVAASPFFKYLPSGWAFNAVSGAANGDIAASALFVLILGACSLILTFIAFKMTAKFYADGITEEFAGPSKLTVNQFTLGGSPLMAHIRRDLILFSRESGVLMQSLIMAIFLLLYPFIANGDKLQKAAIIGISPVTIIFAAFFGGQVGNRMLAIERLGFWTNLVIPAGRQLVLAGKFITGLAFTTLLSALVATIHLIAMKSTQIDSIILTVMFSWAGFGVGVIIASFWSNFSWEHPKRMLKGGGGFVYVIAIILFGIGGYGVAYLAYRLLSGLINPIIILAVFFLGILSIAYIVSALKIMNMEWTPDV